MGKLTNQTKDLSGDKYEFEKYTVEISPTFIYEVSLHKYWKNGYCFLGNKLYSSNKLLNTKDNVVTKFDNYFISKEINLIGVPKKFIEDNNLKLYKPFIKKLKK